MQVALLILAAALASSSALASPQGGAVQDDAAAAALVAPVVAAFEAKCVPCHVPGSDSPKATRYWADARDLSSAVEEFVVPGDPEDSTLWLLIEDGEMPPEDSDVPALTGPESQAVRAWIQAGAPLPATNEARADSDVEAQDPQVEEREANATAAEVEVEEGARQSPLLSWLGRLHPAAVHMPIGMLLGAAFAELLAMFTAGAVLFGAVRYCTWLAVPSSVAAATLGWLNAASGGREPTLTQHRWMGVATAASSLVLLLAVEARARAAEPRRWNTRVRVLLLAITVLVGLTGHWGGTLTFGPGYLDFPGFGS